MVQTRSAARAQNGNTYASSASVRERALESNGTSLPTPFVQSTTLDETNFEQRVKVANGHTDKNGDMKNKRESATKTHPMVYVTFVSLLLDLLAFTMILPLFPSLLDHYQKNDGPNSFYHNVLGVIRYFQTFVGAPDHTNSVLFGGFLGSMYSFLQFIATPLVGGLSDVYGRKPVLLICLVGIASSYLLWAISHNFILFVIARFVGGLSKGNVSLSISIMGDVSSEAARGVGMALVGIAFSVGFIVGPLIGAIFAKWAQTQSGAWFVWPALFALFLALADILFVAIFFKETLPKNKRAKSIADSLSQAVSYVFVYDLFSFTAVKDLSSKDLSELRCLGAVNFIYLFLYSGLEFTLTFLTHHKFSYTSMQQGLMFFAIGSTMAIVQGAFVRRVPSSHTKSTAVFGLLLTVPAYIFVGVATSLVTLYFGLFLYAVSTALVVPCMMTLVSKLGADHQKGTAMGIFRSLGALARASGPIVASIAYWSLGSMTTYLTGGLLLLLPWFILKRTLIQ